MGAAKPEAPVAASEGFDASPRGEARPAVASLATHPVWSDWRFDGAFVVGVVVLLAYLVPARLVVPGLGAAGVPALVAGLALLIAWLAAHFLPDGFVGGRNPLRTSLFVFALAFLVSYALAFAGAMPLSDVNGADRALLRMAGLLGVALVVLDGIRHRHRLDALLKTLLAGGLVMAVIGSMQFHLGIDVTPVLRPPLLTLNAAQLIGISERGVGLPRVASTANHYIEFGVLMAMLAPLAVHYSRHALGKARRAFYGLAAVLFTVSTFYSVSRTALVALAVAALVLLLGGPLRRSVNLLAAAGVVAALVWLAFPDLVRTFVGLFSGDVGQASVQSRTTDYPLVWPLVTDKPFFGRGPGTYSPSEYLLLDNQWLNSLITLGIVGTVALALVFVVGFTLARRCGAWAAEPEDRSLGHSLCASIAAAFVASFLFDSLAFSTFAITTFVLIAAAGALWRLAGQPQRPR